MKFPHPTLVTLLLTTTSILTHPVSASDQQTSLEYTSASAFQLAILNTTNTYRTQHNATSLKWNDTLAKYAEKWSGGCEFKHSGGPSGENLAAGYANATAAVNAWGHERVDYDFKKGEFSHETGHFTQMVWKSTATLGCSPHFCNTSSTPGWYIVCEYFPAGNVLGSFTENVQAAINSKEECPQGAVCSAATSIRRGGIAVWAMVVAGVMVALS